MATESSLIIHRVKVNRKRAPRKALEATGRRLFIDDDVVNTMPRGKGDEVEVYFFNLNRYISDDELEKEYEFRRLVPADPFSLTAVNEADPDFANTHPNCTHWKDSNGKWCYIAFDQWLRGELDLSVAIDDRGWPGGWWFAGLRNY